MVIIHPASAETPKHGGVLISPYIQFPPHFNPAIQSGVAIMAPGAQLFASLLEFDDKWQPVPYLAKSWEISDDGLTYTFHLVEDATFHDGKPITSEDVAFSFEIVKKNHPFGVAMFGPVDRVETPVPHTAVFKLSRPHPALLLSLSPVLLPILPKHVYGDGQPIRKHPANTNPVGSGPFRFMKYKPGEYFIFERYDKFFRKGLPYLDRVIGRRVRDLNAVVSGLKSGELHMPGFRGGLRLAQVAMLKKVKHLGFTKKGYEAIGPTTYLQFNLRRPILKDLRVRKAIAYAVDRNFIVQKLQRGFSHPCTGPLHHTSPFYTPDVEKCDLDLAKANKLLDEAGYPKNKNGFRFSLTVDWLPMVYDDGQVIAE
jgi:peptide/nickel transport system substrate-binding protein